MLSKTISLLIIASFMALTQQQYSGSGKTDYTRIPSHLNDCYSNQTLYERDNRIPSTISSLIAIIQKLENDVAINMDMRTLSTTILYRYRLDGIERDPKIISPGVLPFSPTGFQVNRLSILLDSLLPPTGNVFPNGTLTPQELCALHFMLSDSIDIWDRGDSCETLSPFNSRRPRSVDDLEPKSSDMESNDSEEEEEMNGGVMPPVAEENKTKSADDSSTEAALDTKLEEDSSEVTTTKTVEVGVHKLLPKKVERSGRLAMHPVEKSAKMFSDYPRSDCPVENGVIYTPAGAVSAGIMLAGIASGLQTQSLNVNRLLGGVSRSGARSGQSVRSSSGIGSRGLSSGDDTLSNLWFATVAADLGEAALLQGPTQEDISIGASGGWNDTTMPRWYFLKIKAALEMTDAEIRGGLDGMIMGRKIGDWYSAFNQRLRLSQVLDMYYSERGISGSTDYKACKRKDNSAQATPMEEMIAQSKASAEVLMNKTPFHHIDSSTLLAFVEKACQRLSSYLPSGLVDPPCASATETPSIPSIDLLIVLDTTWSYVDVKTLIGYLAERIKLGEYGKEPGVSGGGGSKLTIISAKDGTLLPIVNGSTSLLDFYANFTYDVYSQLPTGFDIKIMLDRIRTTYALSLQKDHQVQVTSGRPQAVLFLPTSFNPSDTERSQALSKLNKINTKSPDTRFFFMSPLSKDVFGDFVVDKDKDIFQISSTPDYKPSLDPLIARFAQIPRRMINPACTYKWDSDGGSGSSTQYADPASSSPLLLRLHPNYFFKSDSITIKFQGRGDGALNVCYSRKPILTVGNTNSSSSSSPSSSSTKCKTINSDTVEFSESQPCSGAGLIKSCSPMYFAVSATSTNNRCFDNDCRYPDMVRFTVTHSGLTCTSGAKGLLTSGLSIALWIILFSSREATNRIFFSG